MCLVYSFFPINQFKNLNKMNKLLRIITFFGMLSIVVGIIIYMSIILFGLLDPFTFYLTGILLLIVLYIIWDCRTNP
jgi:hypothetical protein